jgi:hypothetical protein
MVRGKKEINYLNIQVRARVKQLCLLKAMMFGDQFKKMDCHAAHTPRKRWRCASHSLTLGPSPPPIFGGLDHFSHFKLLTQAILPLSAPISPPSVLLLT